jgi:putative endonuclease
MIDPFLVGDGLLPKSRAQRGIPTATMNSRGMNSKTQNPVRKFQRCYFVYIIASLRGTLYVGLTDDLRKRILQHRAGTFDGFTKKYKVNRLMYFETYTDSKFAEHREIQLKKYRREKKIALFKDSNPGWEDLSREIFAVYRDPSLRSGFQKTEPQ